MRTFTETELLQAISAEEEFPVQDLPEIFRNRGYRDALVCLAIKNRRWEDLVEAARRSIAERGTQEHEVPYGEFTVLAMAAWRSNGELYPNTTDLRELMLHGPKEDIRMLNKMILVQEQGIPFSTWEGAMAQLDIAHCIRFAIQEKTEGRG
jgi:hypothetical protein